jgi:hypothetical protein
MREWFGVLVLCVGTLGLSEEAQEGESFYRDKMTKSMELAGRWLIEDGLSVYYQEGPESVGRVLIDKWAVQLAVKTPWVDEGENIADIPITAKGIHFAIHCLHRVKTQGAVYEYWLINRRGPAWFGDSRASFHITRASRVDALREVVHSSDQFVESFTVDGVVLTLPLKDLQLLYKMEAWKYRGSYQGFDFADMEVSLDKHGYFVVGKGWWQRTGHLFRGIFGPERERFLD